MTEIRKFSKRLFSVILAVCMALAFIPLQTAVTASAAGNQEVGIQLGSDSRGAGLDLFRLEQYADPR